MRNIIPISGKDSLCTALIQTTEEPDLTYEFMFNPTGSELPEVFEWLEKVETYFNQPVTRIGEDLEGIIEKYNYFLPSRLARYCTRQSKIEPMLKFIGEDEAVVYFGIRADENRGGFNNQFSPNIEIDLPLKRHKIGINEVYQIINKAGLKPPVFFWDRLYNEVKRRVGFDPREILTEWIFDMLFAWRTRANCYHCFNQRQYEIVGLWEHHPDLAEKALWYESQGGEKAYTWREKPFDWYRENSERIFQKRVGKITKVIRAQQQLNLFSQSESEEDGFLDLFTYSSCGLLCGK
jgi:hypothetical protein